MRHFARDCRAKGNQDSKKRDDGYNRNKTRYNGRRHAYQDDSKALVTIDGEDIDWPGHVEEDAQNYAMMAFSSSNSGSDNEVKSCSKACEESYARLKKLYDDQRDKLGDASIEITAYTLALKRYGDYRYGSILSYENEVLQSVFMNKASKLEDTPVNDRYADGMHAVLPLMTGNYMPSRLDVEIYYFKFTYGPKQTSTDESDSKPSEYAYCEFDSNVETSTSMPEPVENASKVVCEPKVWTDAPIIEEYESDSDNDSVSNLQEDKEKPSFAFTNFVKHEKTSKENIKETCTTNHSPKIKKQERNGHTKKGLEYAFTRKACFVCCSFSHLIRDCDFHEKRMAKQAELTKSKHKITGQRENRPVWNNVQRVNQQNKFVPLVLLTKTGKFPVNVARQNYSSQAASTSTTSKVNNSRPFVNETRLKRIFYKTHSPNKRPFHNTTAQKTTFLYQKVNAVRNKSLSAVGGNGDTAVKASAWNKAYLADYQEFKGGSVAFGGSIGRITGKEKIKTGRVLVTKPQNKTPYELLTGKQPIISYLRPFGCHVTILNTIDQLGMFDGKSDSGFLLGYSLNKNQANKSVGLKEANNSAGTQANDDQGANSENASTSSTNLINTASTPFSTAGPSIAFNDGKLSYLDPSKYPLPDNPLTPHLEDIYANPSEGIFTDSSYDDEGV
nr:retrovirus-related Pol polyprotein from transposon TNT 1-94 [Tanacetum cinerariifolium]